MPKRKAQVEADVESDDDYDSEEDDGEMMEGEGFGVDDDDEELEAEMAALESSRQGNRRPEKVYINNKAGLEASILDFAWTHKAKWIDHMAVAGEEGVESPADINDDLTRETYFYEQALASANVAIKRLKDLGIAVKRPEDFYAEMVKSDEHMKRVRAELIFEQTSQETREERRKAREQKRYGKQVQAEKIKERTLQKKESIKSIEKWRKTRKHNDFADDGKAPEGFTDEKRGQGGKTVRDRGSGGGGQHGGGGGAKSTTETQAKREFKDDKFGFGGRKRMTKQNDKESSKDMSGYKPSNFDSSFRAGKGWGDLEAGGRGGGRGGRAGGGGRGRGSGGRDGGGGRGGRSPGGRGGGGRGGRR
uniref:rRNA-processing protein EBP2 n=1 Tax=Mantoniella antarctica TaxID=81844 RepID=A0A7S0SLK1_9CHLO